MLAPSRLVRGAVVRVKSPTGHASGPALTPFSSVVKRFLMSLLGIGVIGTVVGTGSFASFNAQVTNSGNTFATGTLTVTNTSIALSNNTGMSPGSVASGTTTITSSGSLAATMTLTATLNTANTTSNFNQDLNLTIHDDTSGYCIYGATGQTLPYNGACDSLAGLTGQGSATAFPATNTGALTVPGTSGATWAAGEAHLFTVTVEVINLGGVPTSATGALDLQWTGTQTAGTSS